MEGADHELDAGSATYEIHLQGTPSEALGARFAFTRVRRRPAQTVLMGRVASQDELADLLERVLALGLVLNEVHEVRVASKPQHPSPPEAGQRSVSRAYEVRIDGQLDNTLLRFLKWRHQHLPEHAAVMLECTPEQVYAFLSDCCRLGLGIDRVRLVKELDVVGA
jgi:predicted trehalose synthase